MTSVAGFDKPNLRILVTGGSGFLGQHVLRALAAHAYQHVAAPSHADYDLTSEAAVAGLLRDTQPDAVIHLAAVVGAFAGQGLGLARPISRSPTGG